MFHKDLLDRVGQELAQCYRENPLCIDDKNLSSLKPNTQFTTTQIAWFFALTKVQQETIGTIEWDASGLIACVHDLENTFVILVEELLTEQGANIQDDVPWEESIITRIESNLSIPTYIVSRPVFVRLFSIWISEKGDINPSKAKNMISRQRRSMEKVRLLGLHQRHLTDHLRSNIHIVCNNNPVRFSLDKIPETIWSKDLAHYLAITAKRLNDYGDVDYDSSPLVQNAKRIHDLLWQTLKTHLRISWKPFRRIKPEHQKLAKQLGVVQIECYANIPERDYLDTLSAMVSKDLAITLLGSLDEFSYLVSSHCYIHTQNGIGSYKGDAINIAVIQYILPRLFPNKNQPLSKMSDLAWNCFDVLPEALNNNGANVVMHRERNKKECHLEGAGRQNETIKIDFDAFRHRFPKLFNAYLNDLSCEKIDH